MFLSPEDIKVPVFLGAKVTQKAMCWGYQLALPYGASAGGPPSHYACPCGTKLFLAGPKYALLFSATQV